MNPRFWLLSLAWAFSFLLFESQGKAFQELEQSITEITEDHGGLEANLVAHPERRTQTSSTEQGSGEQVHVTENAPGLTKNVQSITEIIDDDDYEGVSNKTQKSTQKLGIKEKSGKASSNEVGTKTNKNRMKTIVKRKNEMFQKAEYKDVLSIPKVDGLLDPRALHGNRQWLLPLKHQIKLYQDDRENANRQNPMMGHTPMKNTRAQNGLKMKFTNDSQGMKTKLFLDSMTLIPLQDQIKHIESEIRKEKESMLKPTFELKHRTVATSASLNLQSVQNRGNNITNNEPKKNGSARNDKSPKSDSTPDASKDNSTAHKQITTHLQLKAKTEKPYLDEKTHSLNTSPNSTQTTLHIFVINATKKAEPTLTWSSGNLIAPPKHILAKNNSHAQKPNELDILPDWSPWSTCSATCGKNGLQIRTRKQCEHAHHSTLACTGNAVDWKSCAKMDACPDAPHRIPGHIKNNTFAHVPAEESHPRYQWGQWSVCSDKCDRKNLRVRRRICPGQRSAETGVCLKPTMQWSWCRPKSCNSTRLSAQSKSNSIFYSTRQMQIPSNSSKIAIHKDKGIQFEPNCVTSPWGKWSKCSRTCGENSLLFRSRPCSCNTKARCDKPTIEWRHCTLDACPGEENYSPWSAFSQCSKSCGGGWRKRIRHCIKKKGLCDQDLLIGIRVCNVKGCPKKKQIFFSPVLNGVKDPESICGFVPCEEFGCLDNPYSKCLSDSQCDPVFYDLSGNIENHCTNWQRYVIKKPIMFCGYDPCLTSRCQTEFGKCAVDLECKAVIVGPSGSIIDCSLINAFYKRRLNYKQSMQRRYMG